jgi:spore coat protein H
VDSPGDDTTMKWLVFILWLSAASLALGKPDPGAELFDSPNLRTFKITLAKDQYDALAANNRRYVRATVAEGGGIYSNVAIRLKGMGSFRPLHEKPSFAVKFDEYVDDQKFCGLSKIMLNNSSQDGSYLGEFVSMGLFRDAGLPAPRVTHAFVELNGKNLGTYVLIEPVNKDFLRRHFRNTSGNMYEAYLQDIDQTLDQDNGINIKQSDRKAFVEACGITDPAQRWIRLQQLLEVDQFITHTVLEIFVSHTDGYALNRNNYRLYRNPTTDRFSFITLGADWGFGNTVVSIHPPMNSIVVRGVLGTPEGRAIYRQRLRALYTNIFDVATLTNRVNEAVARLQRAARNPGEAREFAAHGAGMRERIAQRHRNIGEQLAAPEPEPLKFDSGGYARLSGWRKKTETGNPIHETLSESNKVYLHINGDNGPCIASWRSRVLLDGGKYRFEGMARSAGIRPQRSEQGSGAGLRISGGRRANKLEGDNDWTKLEHEFEVPAGGMEVEFVCELRSSRGKVWFDRDSLKIKSL